MSTSISSRVLVTGGAGFIGSFLTDALIERGHAVRILDTLEEQVHSGNPPSYLNPAAEFIRGDVRDSAAMENALKNIDVIIHCAAAVGVGQSQYEIKRYVDVNAGGTATLLDVIVNRKLPIRKILLPTSMTVYGEGRYLCPEHGKIRPHQRSFEALKENAWDMRCPICNVVVEPVPTPEDALQNPATVYALTKLWQETLLLNAGATHSIPVVAFRLFNVYGPRQSLKNPYTGVTAIFLSRLKNGQPPVIYEDGLQTRDFVSVHDVVRAFLLAMDRGEADGRVLNIGSGSGTSILSIAETLRMLTGSSIAPRVGGCRMNDIRHCTADTTKVKQLLGWQPQVSFEDGMEELVAWSREEEATDAFAAAEEILKSHHLQT